MLSEGFFGPKNVVAEALAVSLDKPMGRTFTLRLPIPLPSKYPTPGGFPMGVSLKQEKPPRLRGLCYQK